MGKKNIQSAVAPKDYAKLKKNSTFSHLLIPSQCNQLATCEEDRIFVEVQRLSDCRKFILPLTNLESVDVNDRSY
jgi:hypothetical protein